MKSLLSRLSPQGLAIFLFHGVIKSPETGVRNYTRKHLPQDEFADLMRALKEHGQPVSMDDVLDLCVSEHNFPANAFAITFDDGFENNYSVAAPILSDLSIPATFYVTTSFVDEGRIPWIDRIEYAFEHTADVRIQLPWRSSHSVATTTQEKIVLLSEIRREVKANDNIEPEHCADDILEEMGVVVRPSEHPLDKKMTWSQIQQLHSQPLFTVGGHSHTHAILSRLSPSRLDDELDTSLSLLRSRAGVTTRHYSYPEGQRMHFSDVVIAALKMRGIECCPTAIDGTNMPGTDPFHLKRVMVDRVCAE